MSDSISQLKNKIKTAEDLASEMFWEYLQANHKGQGPCLIPKRTTNCAPICHERDFCECEMRNAFLAGFRARDAEVAELVAALEKIAKRDAYFVTYTR